MRLRPAAWLRKYPNRWELMHIKDLKKGVTGNLSGGTAKENDVAIGTGQAFYGPAWQASRPWRAQRTRWRRSRTRWG